MYENVDLPGTVTYTWVNETVANKGAALVDGSHTIKTNETTSGLGSVNGDVNLTIRGTSIIGTSGDPDTGNVYGGGDQSSVKGSAHKITVTLAGNAQVLGNVYGGGNNGIVEGSTEVNIQENAPTNP